jgi:hypothetical protein
VLATVAPEKVNCLTQMIMISSFLGCDVRIGCDSVVWTRTRRKKMLPVKRGGSAQERAVVLLETNFVAPETFWLVPYDHVTNCFVTSFLAFCVEGLEAMNKFNKSLRSSMVVESAKHSAEYASRGGVATIGQVQPFLLIMSCMTSCSSSITFVCMLSLLSHENALSQRILLFSKIAHPQPPLS